MVTTQNSSNKVRLVKVVKITLNKRLTDVESKVNAEIMALAKEGHKIVSITHFVCGNSPIYVVYNIVYEKDMEGNEDYGKKEVE